MKWTRGEECVSVCFGSSVPVTGGCSFGELIKNLVKADSGWTPSPWPQSFVFVVFFFFSYLILTEPRFPERMLPLMENKFLWIPIEPFMAPSSAPAAFKCFKAHTLIPILLGSQVRPGSAYLCPDSQDHAELPSSLDRTKLLERRDAWRPGTRNGCLQAPQESP